MVRCLIREEIILLEAEVGLRQKNQLTLPEPIASQLGAQPGDHLVITVLDDEPGIARIRRLPRSYAGSMSGLYGTPEEVAVYVRKERESWTK